ncbi:hypothetical protein HPB52_007198 [Rhipicephalus sanguineus]|uniref:Uncharacterized protein n=1 Tax=Rhipicephalus sanguineus TaxID=34632 RepID=A0A9D4T8T5_RHISA|nr:hypothetical protein HPB52_007198 [Rhipicephalus sanguineus]
MFHVLEYHLPRDLKVHLTYFSWSPRLTMICKTPCSSFTASDIDLFPSDTAPPGTPSSTWTPPAPRPVQTVHLPTTGYTGGRHHPPVPIDPSTERPTILESTTSDSDVLVLPPEPLPPLSITDSTPATAPCTVAFAAESCDASLTTRGDSTVTFETAHVAAEHTPVLIPLESHDTAYTTDAEPAFALHASGFANTSGPVLKCS